MCTVTVWLQRPKLVKMSITKGKYATGNLNYVNLHDCKFLRKTFLYSVFINIFAKESSRSDGLEPATYYDSLDISHNFVIIYQTS
jgi:hypothetical protein